MGITKGQRKRFEEKYRHPLLELGSLPAGGISVLTDKQFGKVAEQVKLEYEEWIMGPGKNWIELYHRNNDWVRLQSDA